MYPLVPVIIEYYTCFLNEKNEVMFRDDIYGMDKAVLVHLRKQDVN